MRIKFYWISQSQMMTFHSLLSKYSMSILIVYILSSGQFIEAIFKLTCLRAEKVIEKD